MKNKKDIVLLGISLLVLAVLVVGTAGYKSAKAEGSFWGGVQSIVAHLIYTNKVADTSPDFTIDEGTFGALSSPIIPSRYLEVGGVRHYYFRDGNLNQASTTVCSFYTPAATTTLVFASIRLTTGTSTTPQWEIGKGTTMDATTTSFGTFSLSASDRGTMVASTTSSGFEADMPTVFAPNTYLNFKYGGDNGASYSTNVFTGDCRAEFIAN